DTSRKFFSPDTRSSLQLAGQGLVEVGVGAEVVAEHAIAAPQVAGAIGLGGGILILVGLGYELIAGDHPDPNFTALVQAPPHTVPTVRAGGRGTQAEANAFNALFANGTQILGVQRALLTTLNRISGAAAAGNTFWEVQQRQAADRYTKQLASLMTAEA